MATPLPRDVHKAVVRYAPRVERLAQRKYGIHGGQLLRRLVAGESAGDPGAVSSAGARGRAQFMPGTRQAVLDYTGGKVDPWRSADEAVHAATIHLRGELGHAKGLEGYNPGGGRAYVDYILGQRVPVPREFRGRAARGGKRQRPRASAGQQQLAVELLGQYGVGGSSGVAEILAGGMGRPQVPVSAPPEPVFSARARLPVPEGYQAPPSSGAPAPPRPSLDAVLAAIRTPPGQIADPAAPAPDPQRRARGGGGRVVRAGGWPTARRGPIIGTPGAGTHTLGNWQSDNAVDIRVPNGTRILAAQGGRVVKVAGGYSGGQSRFDGYQVTIETPGGGQFYTHLSKALVKPGDRVKRGQVIGRSGSANGVPHLHFGVEKGDPRRFVQ